MSKVPIVYKFTFEQPWEEIDLDTEDQGMALIYNIENNYIPELFIKIQSWDENKKHKIFNESIRGRKLKVTIETLD